MQSTNATTREKNASVNAMLEKITKKLPDKKYKIILADPPWTYNDKALAGRRGAGCKYDTMTLDELKRLPVPEIADKNCVLFMWCTWPQIEGGLELIESWGFTYKTKAFTWVKTNSDGTLFMGMGGWTRSNDEFVLLATKGKPKRVNAGINSVILSPIQDHSKKPHIFRTKIIELMGDLPRIELFARTKVHGWDTWGNDDKLELQPLEYF